ncbi:hypothetical protein WJU16_24410 [Chitinophaga pollutisoli]|uniref:Uncharacterized protein n=1 Tax=Chitinophaga pollutisoli TaxID=3133966 RepID=A0ABZ2YNR3_9BACT
MKKVLSFIALPMTVFFAGKASAQSLKTDSFTVSGNCNMCKKRIEKAADSVYQQLPGCCRYERH